MATATIELPRLHPGQLELESAAKRFNVVANGRRWGKTVFLTRRACKRAIAGEKYGWFCQEYSFLLEAFDAIRRRLAPIIKRADRSSAPMIIETNTGGLIEFWSLDNPDAGRSRKYHEACIDEAGIVKNLADVWSKNIRSTLLDYAGMAWFMGTPKGRNDFYDFFQFGKMEGNDWGSFTKPTNDNPYISDEEIEEMRNEPGMTEKAFEQEINAKFLKDTEGLFFEHHFVEVDMEEVPDLQTWYVGYDCANKAKQSNDPTAYIKFGIDNHGNPWVINWWWERLPWGELCTAFENQAIQDGMNTEIGIEDAANGTPLIYEMTNPATRPHMAGFTIRAVSHGNKDKKYRASPIAARAQIRPIRIVRRYGKQNTKEFIDIFCKFDGLGTVMDDIVDAFSTAWAIAFREEGNTQIHGIEDRIARNLGLSYGSDRD